MGLDLGAIQNDYKGLKASEGSGGSFLENFVKMPEGKGSVVMRLLPPKEGKPFYLVTALHRVNGKSLHDIREYSRETGKWVGHNPIVDYMRHLWKESEKDGCTPAEAERKRALYRQIKPVERYYYNVIVREERGEDGAVRKNVGPKILSVGKMVHEIILRGILGDKEMNQPRLGDVTDQKVGYDFKLVKTIRKSGDQQFPNYESSHFLEQSPAGTPDEWKTWLENLHDLETLRILKTPEELEHELQVHLGLKQETTGGGFDPSKFAKPVEAAAASAPVAVSAKVETETDDDDDVADKDFIEELKRLG
jgi:hypothetical protein